MRFGSLPARATTTAGMTRVAVTASASEASVASVTELADRLAADYDRIMAGDSCREIAR